MERCLICGEKMQARKGKVVCSTTCRVNKKKAFDECDRLFNHFVKLKIGRNEFGSERSWQKSIVAEIVAQDTKNKWYGVGNVAEAWARKKHPPRKFEQLDIELK